MVFNRLCNIFNKDLICFDLYVPIKAIIPSLIIIKQKVLRNLTFFFCEK